MWAVHKFGGTSVAGAERYRNVAKIAQAEKKSAWPSSSPR
jgi:aspartokinase